MHYYDIFSVGWYCVCNYSSNIQTVECQSILDVIILQNEIYICLKTHCSSWLFAYFLKTTVYSSRQQASTASGIPVSTNPVQYPQSACKLLIMHHFRQSNRSGSWCKTLKRCRGDWSFYIARCNLGLLTVQYVLVVSTCQKRRQLHLNEVAWQSL